MANPVLAAVSRNPVLRAGVVGATILTLVGVVSGALPVLCYSGVSCTPSDAAPAAPISIEAPENPVAAKAPAKTVALAEVIEPQGVSLTRNDVVAATFQTLKVELEALAPSAITTRTVKTVAIRADGSLATPAVEVAAVAADEAVVAAAAEPEVAVATPAKPAASKKKSTSKSGVVKGTGANVRSSPVKGENTVLFALAGGTRVTIAEVSNGWYKITDKAGRSGWVYGDLVSR